MDKDELDIYLELAKEAENDGDYRTADKIDGMIRTAFELNRMPPWFQTFLRRTRNPATIDTAADLVDRGINSRGRRNWFNDMMAGRRMRGNSGVTDPAALTFERSSPLQRGDVIGGDPRSTIKNLFFTRGGSNYEVLNDRFREQIATVMDGSGGLRTVIAGEIARLRALHPTMSNDDLRRLALQEPAVVSAIAAARQPVVRLLETTQAQLRDKINEAMNAIQHDAATRRRLGLTGPFTAADLSDINIGKYIAGHYPKLLGQGSEISGEVFKRFISSGTKNLTTGTFSGGAIDPETFFYKMGGKKLLPSGMMYILPALLGGMVIRPVIDPPRPKPGPDVVPVTKEPTKIKNELEADRKPAGQYRTPEPQLQAYILAKGFKGAFQQGKTTKRELYDMALAEKGEAFANDLIQYALKTFGLGGGIERNAPIG